MAGIVILSIIAGLIVAGGFWVAAQDTALPKRRLDDLRD